MSFGQRFLEYPDLFPGRPSGEPWGEREVHLRFPGSPIGVAGLSDRQAEELSRHFESVVPHDVEAESPVTWLRVFRAPLSDFRTEEDQGFDLDFEYWDRAVLVAGWHTMARFDWTPELSAALWTPHQEGFHLTSGFENLTRALVAYRLSANRGALVHSAAAGDDEEAILFVGHSGAGKTTIWKLLGDEGATVLCDDLNSVYLDGDQPWVASTPFSTVEGLRERPIVRRRLSKILHLRQGAERALDPLAPADAVARLFANTPFLNRDHHRSDEVFDTIEQLCEKTPAAELTFSTEPGLWTWLSEQNP